MSAKCSSRIAITSKEQLEEGCGRHIFRESNAISYQIVAKLSRLMCRHVAQIAVHSTAISFEIELVYGTIKVLSKNSDLNNKIRNTY